MSKLIRSSDWTNSTNALMNIDIKNMILFVSYISTQIYIDTHAYLKNNTTSIYRIYILAGTHIKTCTNAQIIHIWNKTTTDGCIEWGGNVNDALTLLDPPPPSFNS